MTHGHTRPEISDRSARREAIVSTGLAVLAALVLIVTAAAANADLVSALFGAGEVA